MIGLARGSIALCDHNKEWEVEAARTAAHLRGILGKTARAVEHIGSTAVPTIKAKPIIDIAVGADRLSDVLAYEERLAADGFFYRHAVDGRGNIFPGLRRLNDNIERLLFACGDYYTGGTLQTHFIHAVRYGGATWNYFIIFRECLRFDPDLAREYVRFIT